MKSIFRLKLLISAVLFHLLLPLWAQGILPQTATQEVVEQAGSDSVQILAFATTEIPNAFGRSNALISESGQQHFTEKIIASYQEEVDTLFFVIRHFLGDSTFLTLEGISSRELDQIAVRVDYYQDELDQTQGRLSNMAMDIEGVTLVLSNDRKRWEKTLEATAEEELMETRQARIQRTIHRLDSVRGLLQEDMSILLLHQDRISDKKNALDLLLTRIRDQKTVLGEQLFSKEMPGLFAEFKFLSDSLIVREHLAQIQKSVVSDLKILKDEYATQIIVASVLFLVFLLFAVWYKRHFARMLSVDKFELSDMHMAIVYSPAITVVFLVSLLIRFLLPDLPRTFGALNGMIMMAPLTVIVIRLFGKQIRTWVMALLLLFALAYVYELSYTQDILQRVFLLGFSLAGLYLFIWLFIKKPLAKRFGKSFVYSIFRILILFFSVLLLISIIANLMGAFSLAEFLTLLPIQITVLALGIQVTVRVADTLLYLLLASNYMQKVNVIREEFDIIYRKSVLLVDLFLWLFFFSNALRIFRIKDGVFEWGLGILTNGFSIGEVNISLGNILIFIFVIWLSIIITRMISHVLEKDVFTRVKMEKGIPSTIIMLLRVVLISGGFFLAAKASGMALDNISIVIGAFSVGIGFGLQNIFNNMVSGLILAFERPIKVGDVVQVGELLGTVASIGLRSSIVRSYEGAEVIVPNGNLISNQMINWTKSDYIRRMDIRIGVAYGSDPEAVKAILKKIAAEHDKVRRIPMPEVFFIDFGDSSLDFRLLAWVHVDYKLTTESDLRLALNRELKDAGIEIPFPQTDLHVRSDDTKVQAATKPVLPKKPKK